VARDIEIKNAADGDSIYKGSIDTNPIAANPIAANSITANSIDTNPIAANPIDTDSIATNPIAANSIDIRIYYEDTDCGGVVYYGKYLSYLERARTAYLEGRGVNLSALMAEGIYFVVVHVDIKYHSPARYGDIVTVRSAVEHSTPATITFRHNVVRKACGTNIATSTVKLACVGGEAMKPRRLPEGVRAE
jgi:acyl-CoA thioester hydrolase